MAGTRFLSAPWVTAEPVSTPPAGLCPAPPSTSGTRPLLHPSSLGGQRARLLEGRWRWWTLVTPGMCSRMDTAHRDSRWPCHQSQQARHSVSLRGRTDPENSQSQAEPFPPSAAEWWPGPPGGQGHSPEATFLPGPLAFQRSDPTASQDLRPASHGDRPSEPTQVPGDSPQDHL